MRRTWATLTVASGLVLAGCGSADEGTSTSAPSTAAEGVRTVEHAAGTTEITGTPERVVVLDTGELDAVLALGVTPVGAVRTGVSDELPAYIEDAGVDPTRIANVGTIAEPALEEIAALEPDLILSNAVRHADVYDQLSAIAPTVLAEAIGETWEDNLRLAGEALGLTDQAEQLLADYEERAAEVGAAAGGAEPWEGPGRCRPHRGRCRARPPTGCCAPPCSSRGSTARSSCSRASLSRWWAHESSGS